MQPVIQSNPRMANLWENLIVNRKCYCSSKRRGRSMHPKLICKILLFRTTLFACVFVLWVKIGPTGI